MDAKIRMGRYVFLGDIANITDGIHSSIHFDEISHINLISAMSPKENIFDLSGNSHISERQHKKNPRTNLHVNDIIISTVGTIGNCAVVNEDILPANCDRHVGIIRLKDNFMLPRFVSTFLLTKYGRFQTRRHVTGNVQPNLFIEKINLLIIPLLTHEFQLMVDRFVMNANEKFLEAKKIFQYEEDFLSASMGIKDPPKTNVEVSIRNFSDSFEDSGRLDAEYYQPKYDVLFRILSKYDIKKLSTLVDIEKSIEPGSDMYCEKGIPFIRVGDMSKFNISHAAVKVPYNIQDNVEKLYPKKDTILFSKDGSVGIAYKVTEDLPIITSSALLHLIVKDASYILPDYLTLILNSPIVQLQAERDSGGSIIQHWKPSEIADIQIPVLPMEEQIEISNMVKKSFGLREQSLSLLGIARHAVEIAIEEGEKEAIIYINKHTNEVIQEENSSLTVMNKAAEPIEKYTIK